MEDIQAFRDSGGVINYFVPPRQIHPYNDNVNDADADADSRDDNSSAAGHPHDFSPRTPNNTASNVSLVDMDQGMRETNLSRSTSFDTGGDKSASGKGDHRASPPFIFLYFILGIDLISE